MRPDPPLKRVLIEECRAFRRDSLASPELGPADVRWLRPLLALFAPLVVVCSWFAENVL